MDAVGGSRPRTRTEPARGVGVATLLVGLVSLRATAHGQGPSPGSGAAGEAPEERNAAEIGTKLSDPVSNVCTLLTEYDLNFSDGDVNRGSSKVGGQMLFQSVLPFPLYGKGDDAWKLITRPVIPIVFSTPIPTGPNELDHQGGLADIQLPMLVAPPAGDQIRGGAVTVGLALLSEARTQRPRGANNLHWDHVRRAAP